jgi:hypothetical protein
MQRNVSRTHKRKKGASLLLGPLFLTGYEYSKNLNITGKIWWDNTEGKDSIKEILFNDNKYSRIK